jgi:Icc-related predicted phosphoesterase
VSGAGQHLGSQALADAIERIRPPLAVCGHIHESWGARSRIGETEVANLGPDGAFFELD